MFEKMLFTHSLFSFPASCCGLLRFASHNFFQKKNRKKKADNPSGQQRKPRKIIMGFQGETVHSLFIGGCGVAARYNLAAFLPVDCGNFLF
jgi:hypothetical protein